MNHWHDDYMAEHHRQQILQEVAQIRLGTLALKSRRRDGPRWFERTMFNVANWMIFIGEHLRKRYEISKEERWINPLTKVTL